MNARPTIATTSLAGCFGCHMSLLDVDERIEDLAARVEFDRSPLVDRKTLSHGVDVGLVEGGCCNEENVHVLRQFRERCRVLVAVGDCALCGGVPAMRNAVPLEECLREAYLTGPTVAAGARIPDDPRLPALLDRVVPCSEVVRVDASLPGCPPSPEAILEALQSILAGPRDDRAERPATP